MLDVEWEELKPLVSIQIEATADNEWGQQLLEMLPGVLDREVPEEQQDAYWVEVDFTLGPKTKFIILQSNAQFRDRVNQVLGRALITWRVEDVYQQKNASGLTSLLMLMNTVSLQDIMALGA